MVYETEIIPIEEQDYIGDLQCKALEHIKRSSLRLIEDIDKGLLDLISQPNHPHINFLGLDESSGEIFPHLMSCEQSINIIRSCSRPFPGAFVTQDDKTFRVWTAKIEASEIETDKNCIVTGGRLFIALKDGHIVSDEYELIE